MIQRLVFPFRGLGDALAKHGVKGGGLLLEYWGKNLASRWRRGTVSCPCCGWQGRDFRPLLIMPLYVRSHAQCPGCQSLERHRALLPFYRKMLPALPDGPVVHYAAEQCFQRAMAEWLGERYVKAYYLDEPLPVSSGSSGQTWVRQPVRLCDGQAVDTRGDLQRMEWRDASLAGILHNFVLAHVRDEAQAIREHARVLKRGGLVLLTTSLNYQIERTKELEKPDGLDAWRLHAFDLQDRFAAAGFACQWHELTPPDAKGRGLRLHALVAVRS